MATNNKLMIKQDKELKLYARSDEVIARFASVVGNQAGAYIASALIAVANGSDKLKACTPDSIMYAALRAATLGLSCDPALGHAGIVPYKGAATFQPQYKGLIKLARRGGNVVAINAGKVWKGQTVVMNQLLGFIEKIDGLPDGSKEVEGWFAHIEFANGFKKSEYMTIQEIEEWRNKHVKNWDQYYSMWKKDPEVMHRKTPLKLLVNQWGDLSPDARAILSGDDRESFGDLAPAGDMPKPEDVTPPKKETQAELYSAITGGGTLKEPEAPPAVVLDAKAKAAPVAKPVGKEYESGIYTDDDGAVVLPVKGEAPVIMVSPDVKVTVKTKDNAQPDGDQDSFEYPETPANLFDAAFQLSKQIGMEPKEFKAMKAQANDPLKLWQNLYKVANPVLPEPDQS